MNKWKSESLISMSTSFWLFFSVTQSVFEEHFSFVTKSLCLKKVWKTGFNLLKPMILGSISSKYVFDAIENNSIKY